MPNNEKMPNREMINAAADSGTARVREITRQF